MPSHLNEELRVPKQRTAVEVLLPDGGWRRYAVFLAASSGAHAGPERVSDLLAAPGDFFPALEEGGSRVAMLSRSAIAAVRVEPWAEADTTASSCPPFEHPIEVTLANGLQLRGLLCFAAPADHARVVDHLNAAPPFFALQESAAVALVNKRHVARVELT
jgi:hypothetical protein